MARENLRKGNKEPMTNRLTALLLKLDYTFDLKYKQGRKLHASVTLSGHTKAEDVHDEIILNFLQNVTMVYI